MNTGGAGGRLAGFVTKVDEFSVHTTAYIDIRSQHLVKIFSVLANACTGIQTTTSGGGGGNGAAAANNNNNAKQGVINTSTTTTASTSAGGDLATAISGYQKGSGKILAFTRALFKALKVKQKKKKNTTQSNNTFMSHYLHSC